MDDHRTRLEAAYAHCLAVARSHYENFPVASVLLPARLRRPVAAIYAFARGADDIADEGEVSAAERLAQLAGYRERLDAIGAGRAMDEPVFIALADTIARHELPLSLFHDLLTAFERDVTQTRYADFDALLDYCRYSANPVGRLLLHLYRRATPVNIEHADCICTALQLINFLQDIGQDLEENNRIYIPTADMQAQGIDETDLRARRDSPALRALIDIQIDRAATLMARGRPLGRVLPGRVGFELRLVIEGGTRILQRLRRTDLVFARPRLGFGDRLRMLGGAIFYRRSGPAALGRGAELR